MEFINTYIISVSFPSLLTVAMFVLVAILYNVYCTRLIKAHQNKQQKEPEENDERFATGKCFVKLRLECY